MKPTISPWFSESDISHQSQNADCQLICFPPAGAGAGFFSDWYAGLPHVDILPVLLPGRDGRFNDEPIDNVEEIADQVAHTIASTGWKSPTLLGYSFGALAAYETVRVLESKGILPKHLIVCARSAPQTSPVRSIADLPNTRFLERIRKLGGLPDIVDEMPEFLELLLPVMRADFRANDYFQCPDESCIQSPVTVFSGRHDTSLTNASVYNWHKRTQSQCDFIEIDGGHFFVHKEPEYFFKQLSNVISHVS
jgi:surfactin synthase thioesterase subunit